jgi:pimeloyl-ACP methyl ester carboxylesterase
VVGIFECGDPQGVPLFYFHGFPGSRLEAGFLATAAASAGVRLIGVDRPGMGLSTPVTGRQILDWPSDVARLGDALRFTRFGVVGYSGGGPYAAACAWRIPERLTGCGIVSGAGPVGPVLSMLATVSRPAMAIVRPFVHEAAGARRWVRRNRRLAAPADRLCLVRPDVEATVVSSLVESFRQGSAGPAHEAKLLSRAWGFALEDIRIPIHLWHGGRDRVVPARAGRETAQSIRDCRAVFLDGEGHFSVIVTHAADIVRRCVGT